MVSKQEQSTLKKIIIGMSFVFLLILIIDLPALADRPTTRLQIFVMNGIVTDKVSDELTEQYKNEYATRNEKSDEYILDMNNALSLDNGEPQYLIDAGKITAHIAGKELDIIIAEKEIIEHYGKMDGFEDLQSLLSSNQFDYLKPNLVSKDGVSYAIGLNEQNSRVQSSGEIWLAIPKTSERKSEAINFIEFLSEIDLLKGDK